jgi:hypothetical protein
MIFKTPNKKTILAGLLISINIFAISLTEFTNTDSQTILIILLSPWLILGTYGAIVILFRISDSEQQNKPTLLWLDDLRDPYEKEWEKHIRINIGNPKNYNIIWVKNYYEFTNYISKNIPSAISFDHDLEESHYTPEEYWNDYEKSKEYQEKQNHKRTGRNCAVFLTLECLKKNVKLPKTFIHSANPVGAYYIRKVIAEYLNFEEKYVRT